MCAGHTAYGAAFCCLHLSQIIVAALPKVEKVLSIYLPCHDCLLCSGLQNVAPLAATSNTQHIYYRVRQGRGTSAGLLTPLRNHLISDVTLCRCPTLSQRSWLLRCREYWQAAATQRRETGTRSCSTARQRHGMLFSHRPLKGEAQRFPSV